MAEGLFECVHSWVWPFLSTTWSSRVKCQCWPWLSWTLNGPMSSCFDCPKILVVPFLDDSLHGYGGRGFIGRGRWLVHWQCKIPTNQQQANPTLSANRVDWWMTFEGPDDQHLKATRTCKTFVQIAEFIGGWSWVECTFDRFSATNSGNPCEVSMQDCNRGTVLNKSRVSNAPRKPALQHA